MDTIYQQIKKRRLDLNLLQTDFKKLIGMAQTQYQRIEAGGNLNLRTLQRLAKALKLNIVLIPNEKMDILRSLLESDDDVEQPNRPNSLLEMYKVDD